MNRVNLMCYYKTKQDSHKQDVDMYLNGTYFSSVYRWYDCWSNLIKHSKQVNDQPRIMYGHHVKDLPDKQWNNITPTIL